VPEGVVGIEADRGDAHAAPLSWDERGRETG